MIAKRHACIGLWFLVIASPLAIEAQVVHQTPHIKTCTLPCTIPLQPELAEPTPGTPRRIELTTTDCHFGRFDLRTRQTECTATVTVHTNAAFQLNWSLSPITHSNLHSHHLITRYRIEPLAGDSTPIEQELGEDSPVTVIPTPVWIPGVSGPTATYRLTATASLPPHIPLPRAGTYQTHVAISIAPGTGS